MHPLKHEIFHFGPAMGPLKTVVGSFNAGIGFSQAHDGSSSACKGPGSSLDSQASDEHSKA